LIEHPQRGNYDLDQLRADMHPQKQCREPTPAAGQGLALTASEWTSDKAGTHARPHA
jgi:hypothetical protein